MLDYIKNLKEKNQQNNMAKTYHELTNFFNMKLDVLAKKLKYSYDNILILQGNEDELKSKFPETYQNLLSCLHNMDNRKPIEYARDLVASWLFEDFMVEKFKQLGYSLILSGKDKNRKILPNIRVGSNSDTIFCYNDQNVNLEIITDFGKFWEKHKVLDLRDDKYNKMLSEKAILLAVSIIDKKFALIPISKSLKIERIPLHKPYGYKPATRIYLENISFYNFDVTDIISKLLSIIQ